MESRGFTRIFLTFSLALGLSIAGLIVIWAATLQIPDLQSFEKRKVAQSTKIYDRTGEILLYDLHENVQRTVIPYEEISRNVKNATVAIEDAEFYGHKGIKPKAIARAILVNLTSLGFSQGGSTITQQVVKNSILTPQKLISRKLKEWVLALKLEKVLSKEDILALYLNETPYGGSMYGIEEASQAFFSKSAAEITIAESAYLAALPQAPTYYSPYGNNREKLEDRKNLVLEKMFENKFISEGEYEEAFSEEVEFETQQDLGIKAPHFVFYVIQQLEAKYGKRALEEQGFRVITSLDWELQRKAEEIVNRFALENVDKFNAENAGLVAVDPKTGHILVMVGSRNYFDEEIDGNFNITIANRQPGSAFKPFVYATAFKKGYTPETVVFDLKTQFQSDCEPDDLTSEDGCYSPTNYDDTFRGPVSLRDALAQSINIPAVKTLYLSGLGDSLRTAKDLGISTLTDINRYGLTLVLGGGEVTLLDITSSYGVFANDGVRNGHAAVLRVEDVNGVVVEEFRARPQEVLDPQVARQISDVLSDNDARAPAFGEFSYLYFKDIDVAAKTGTTNDFRDAWIVGYTPNVTVGAWAGNNDNTPMDKKVAGFIIAPLWNAFMREVLSQTTNESFKVPLSKIDENTKPVLRGEWKGGEQFIIDSISGKLATEYTPIELREERVVTDVHSILNWVDKKDPTNKTPKNPENDSQFELWEYPILEWAKENGIQTQDIESVIPKEIDDIHGPSLSPSVELISPQQSASYSSSSVIQARISKTLKFPISRADYFVNNVFVGSSTKSPYSLNINLSSVSSLGKTNILKVVVYDSVLNKGVDEVFFSTSI
ncbi:MAG: PBP1A family penicillin-binding protein [Candidatus Pacebacteria bacterium]|jgi:1A family penicillin-binding protein|nr:PBP1A family penicillin-binding protein [Candidatus Paceibacterota bacterium]|tara:strand:- start:4727 stop:7219 length:2493 start_codon:yes stop_codon:yes gene_type:complete